jgi:hypothetical protein
MRAAAGGLESFRICHIGGRLYWAVEIGPRHMTVILNRPTRRRLLQAAAGAGLVLGDGTATDQRRCPDGAISWDFKGGLRLDGENPSALRHT